MRNRFALPPPQVNLLQHQFERRFVVGEVADQPSRDVVDAIAALPTGPGDRPVEPVTFSSVEIVEG